MKKRAVGWLAFAAVFLLAFLLVIPASPAGVKTSTSGKGTPGLGMKLSKPDASLKLDSRRLATGLPMAASVDLTAYAPPISDQGVHSSCVGFATGYYAKSWWEKKEHPSWDLNNNRYRFSPAFVYNQINGGSDAGASIDDAMDLLQYTGDCDSEEFPYDGDYLKQPDQQDTEAAGQYRISSSWGYFFAQQNWAPLSTGYTPTNDISQVKSWINSGKPVVMGIPIFDDWPDDYGNPPASYYVSANSYLSGDFKGGHAVFIAGYDDNANPNALPGTPADERGGFLLLNSWGPNWNNNGQVWVSYKFIKKWVPEAWYLEDVDSSPSISSLKNTSGGTLTVSGNNFGANRRSSRVGFQGGSTGTVVSWTNSQVKVKAPASAQSGNVYVYDWDGEQSNGKTFDVSGTVAANWMLAEGATWPGFDEWVLVQNPNNSASSVTVAFMTPGGRVPGPSLTVPAMSRVTIHVNEFVPNQDVATAIYVTGGPDVCAERAMYINSPDGKWGCHDSVGASTTSENWYLAEGTTRPGFDEWVLVLNPSNATVQAGVTFQTPSGQVGGPTLSLPPQTRQTVHVNDYMQNKDVSTEVSSLTPGLGVVAERSMYIRTADGKVDCHNSIGATETNSGWGLAEGATWPGFEEWVLVQNPTATPASAQFYFLTPDGVTEGPNEYVGPGERVTVRVNDYMPDSDVSTLVFTEDDAQKVVVERAMYVRAPDGKLGATNSVASLYSSSGWFLPEGCTSQGFDEWVLVMNPSPEDTVLVELMFMTPGGLMSGPSALLFPSERETFHVNDYVTGDVSTLVESNGYVLAERSMYVRTTDGKNGAHCSLGLLPTPTEGVGGGMAAPLTPKEISRLRTAYSGR